MADHPARPPAKIVVGGVGLSATDDLEVPAVEPSDISHDIRTPLTFLQTAAFILRRRLDALATGEATASETLPVAEECVRQIEDAVERIDRSARREASARRRA